MMRMQNPTPEQVEHCRLVEQDLLELIKRLHVEGIDLRVIMAGLGTASTVVMTNAWGPDAASIWFAQQAAMTMPRGERG